MLVEVFAGNVKKYRKIKGVSQEKLAELSGGLSIGIQI